MFLTARIITAESFTINSIVQTDSLEGTRIAVVHEWLVDYSGSERVLEQILKVFPQADLFSVVDFLTPDQRSFIQNKSTRTTFIQSLPWARRHYRQYLPLMPLAIEQLDLRGYDLVISSSHAVAKGVLTGPGQLHISYVHTPMRYAWDLQHEYLQQTRLDRGLRGVLARWMLHRMRNWDVASAMRVDRFIANSDFIRRRIAKVYRRGADVIYPPVEIDTFTPGATRGEFYVSVSRLVPYKRVDLIVEAFRLLPSARLLVIGDGPELKRIKAVAGANVEFLGYASGQDVKAYLQRARALIFAAEEDFGIVPVEAQACGTPVIAFKRGGVLETVRGFGNPNPTGLYFDEQTPEAIAEAIRIFEEVHEKITPENCRRNAERFSTERFRSEFAAFTTRAWSEFEANGLMHRSPVGEHSADPALAHEIDNGKDKASAD